MKGLFVARDYRYFYGFQFILACIIFSCHLAARLGSSSADNHTHPS
jgi:hypothetical protein